VATNAQPIAVVARLLDLSERRIQQLSREGVIPKAERGQYDLVAAVRGYVAYLRDLAVRAQAGAPDFGVERARLIKAKADLAEMGGRRPPRRASPGRCGGGGVDGGAGAAPGPAPRAARPPGPAPRPDPERGPRGARRARRDAGRRR
jgi:hypothetical protein